MDSAEVDKIRFKVGLFVVLSVLITLAALVMFAIKKDFFENMHYFMLVSRSGEELHEGMPVVFSGFRIGVISDLALNENGHVQATLKISERHAQWVRWSSTFTLEKPFIGENKIVLESKNMAAGPPMESKIFEMGVVDDINEVIKRTRPIVDRFDRIAGNIESITRETGAFNQSLKEIHKLIERHEALAADMQNLIRETKREALGPNGGIMRVNRLVDEISVRLTKMDVEQMNILLTNAARVSADVAKSTTDMQLLRQQIDESVARLNLLLKKANDIMPGSNGGDSMDLP
jgi:phospholipid/cholesterol/gamma-HCH transport system substrate-binding protein